VPAWKEADAVAAVRPRAARTIRLMRPLRIVGR
jgi:hypothetical protein